MTLVVQSSSATIAVLQNFASQPGPDGVTSMLGLAGAIPILLGDNIGTTITALLASIGQTKDAKRTAVAHCIFNISGCLLFIWFVKPFALLIQHISPKGPEIEVISRQIANAHTLFNITMTLIWVCLINVMVKIVMTLIPDGKAVDMDPAKPVFLDDKIISQPAAALQLVAKEILRVSEMVKVVVADTITIVKTEDMNELEPLQEKGVQIKKLTDQITEYLASLFSAGTMTEQQAAQTASLMYILSDVERMGTLSVEVAKCVREKVDNRYKYTPEAMEELQKSLKTLEKMFSDSLKALQGDESVQIEKLIKRKDKIMDLDLKMRKEMQLELKEMHERLGITFIYVTHDQEEALTMSDRIAIMHDGVMDQIGSPTDIYERPATKFVATFIGETNVFDGTIKSIVNGKAVIGIENGDVTTSGSVIETEEKNTGFSVGEFVTVSVRPEKLHFSAEPVEGFSVPALVKDYIYVGSVVKCLAVLPNGNEVKMERLAGEELPKSGDKVFICWNPEDAVLIHSLDNSFYQSMENITLA